MTRTIMGLSRIRRAVRGGAEPPGFTIIELLAVVSIIALLVALLMPALQGARKRAKAVVCAQNLHQLGVAIRTYASDNGGNFVGLYCPSYVKGGGWNWHDFMGRQGYIGQQVSFKKLHVLKGRGVVENWRWPILRCPSEKLWTYWFNPDTYSGVPYNNYLNELINSSYDANFYLYEITTCGWCYWGACLPCVAHGYSTPNKPGVTPARSLILMDNALQNNTCDPLDGAGHYYHYYSWRGECKLPCFQPDTFGVKYAYDYSAGHWVTNFFGIRNQPLFMHAYRHPGGTANGLYMDGHVDPVKPFELMPPDQWPYLSIWHMWHTWIAG